MQVGVDAFSYAPLELEPLDVLELAHRQGFAGVQFESVLRLSPNVSRSELEAVRDRAAELGLYLDVGIPPLNPVVTGKTVDELVAVQTRILEGAAVLGCSSVRVFLNGLHGWIDQERGLKRVFDHARDDNHPGVSWPDQIEASVQVMLRLAPVCRDLGIRIAVETHVDVTTHDCLRIAERVGEDVIGVCLDTANLVKRMEHPLDALERVKHLVCMTHIKDAWVALDSRGLTWQSAPCGQGAMPLRAMIERLHAVDPHLRLAVEDHPRTFHLPLFDEGWIDSFRDLTCPELARWFQLCLEGTANAAAAGRLPLQEPPAHVWRETLLQRLEASREFLQSVVASLPAGAPR